MNLSPGMIQFASVPLSAWEKRDKSLLHLRETKKRIAEDDAAHAESGYLKSGVAGATAGALLRGKRGAVAGAIAGLTGQALVRHITAKSKDYYGERSRRGKQADRIPAIAAEAASAGIVAHRVGKLLKKVKLAALVQPTEFGTGSAAESIADKLAKLGKTFTPGGALSNTAGRVAIGAGALGTAGAVTGALAPDRDSNRATSAVDHGVKDGIFGGLLYGASEPLLKKAFPKVHLARNLRGAALIEFASQKEKGGMSTGRKLAAAGLAAAGAAALPASKSFAAPLARRAAARLGAKGAAKAAGGRAVADYIVGSQRALNAGVHGHALGKVLAAARKRPGGTLSKLLGGDGYVDHLTRFRSSHQDALQHMTHELIHRKGGKPIPGADKIWKQHDAVVADLKATKIKHGMNESEALRHVAQKDEHAPYFNRLAAYKAPAIKEYTIKTGAPAAAGLGGAAAVAASAPKDQRKPARGKAILMAAVARQVTEFGGYQQIKDGHGRFVDPLDALSGKREVYHRDEAGKLAPLQVGVAHGQVLRAAYNKGRVVHRWGGRGARLTRDAAHALVGKTRTDANGRPQKREWQKAWFKNAAGAAAVGAALIGHKVALRRSASYRGTVDRASSAVKRGVNRVVPNTFPAVNPPRASPPHLPGMGAHESGHLEVVKEVPADAKKVRARKKAVPTHLAAKLAEKGVRLVEFDYGDRGDWDLRDARGKSARVFAPGARRRERREKRPLERVGVQRKVLGGLIVAGTAAGLVAGHAVGVRRGAQAAAGKILGEGKAARAAAAFKAAGTRAARKESAEGAKRAGKILALPRSRKN